MSPETLFRESPGLNGDALDHEFLSHIAAAPIANYPDLELAEAMVALLEIELTDYGTGMRQRITNADARLLIRTSKILLRRIGIPFPDLPFLDLESFRRFWIQNDMANSYALRRTYIQEMVSPISSIIEERYLTLQISTVLTPISTPSDPKWLMIEEEIRQLRSRFAQAQTAQDFCGVGLACVRIQELLGDIAYDPDKHLPDGFEVPSRGQTANRFGQIIDTALDGSENQKVRALSRKIIDFAQDVKHSGNPSKRDAAIACDATIILVSTIRNLVDPPL
ncbi:MAG: hypothetical protein QM753_16655 [Thermomicrobiales bacterium]